MNSTRPASSNEPARRILLTAFSSDIPGGIAVQAARLLARLQQEPLIEVTFLPVNPRLPGRWRYLQSVKYLRTLATTALYFIRLIACAPSCDVIHVFTASYSSFLLAAWPAIVAGKLYRKKIILNYHGGRAKDHLKRSPLVTRRVIRLADLLVVPSQYLVEIFAQFGFQAHAVPNFIEGDCFRLRERPLLQPIFLSTRHLEPHYNVGCILRAFSLIHARFPAAQLIIAGDGSQRQELELLAQILNLHNVEFTGQKSHDEMWRLYSLADILLNSSDIDNQPVSIIEAFASGMPVIATRVGGVPYLIKDKETGLLVEKGDYDQMAKAAIGLLEDNELALRIRRNALRESRKYSWNQVRSQWLDIYAGLIMVGERT